MKIAKIGYAAFNTTDVETLLTYYDISSVLISLCVVALNPTRVQRYLYKYGRVWCREK